MTMRFYGKVIYLLVAGNLDPHFICMVIPHIHSLLSLFLLFHILLGSYLKAKNYLIKKCLVVVKQLSGALLMFYDFGLHLTLKVHSGYLLVL